MKQVRQTPRGEIKRILSRAWGSLVWRMQLLQIKPHTASLFKITAQSLKWLTSSQCSVENKQKKKGKRGGRPDENVCETVTDRWSGENKILSKEVQIQAQHYSLSASAGMRNKSAIGAYFRHQKSKSSTMLWIKQELKSSKKTDGWIFLCELFLDSFGCPSLALAVNQRLIRSCQIQSLAISF